MGLYVNPPDMDKETYLNTVGTPLQGHQWPPDPDTMFVVLVNNGRVTAAAIVFSEKEWNDFNLPDDPRPKQWFSVPRDKILLLPDIGRQLESRGVAVG